MATVVLAHRLFGAFGDRRTWRRLDSHRVVVPDVLGYGEHAATSEKITIQAQVEHVRDLLGDERVHMVGHSVGGVLASLFTHHPDDVLGLCV